jgi:hypothetical protein
MSGEIQGVEGVLEDYLFWGWFFWGVGVGAHFLGFVDNYYITDIFFIVLALIAKAFMVIWINDGIKNTSF